MYERKRGRNLERNSPIEKGARPLVGNSLEYTGVKSKDEQVYVF